MINLREQIELDLSQTLEAEFGLPVELISPDGVVDSVTGQVLYDTIVADPQTGVEVVVSNPVVTLRRTSLARIPIDGERWICRIPETPSQTATRVPYLVESPAEGGRSLGFIRLYLTKMEDDD